MAQPEDFDITSLHNLVDEALQENAGSHKQSEPAPLKQLPFGLGDTILFEEFARALQQIDPASMQAVLSEVRSSYVDTVVRGDLRTLHTIIRHCKQCPSVEGEPQLPLGNFVDPDVVFIHELPHRNMQIEKDFDALLGEIEFPRHKITHTSIIRCDPDVVRPPNAEEISNCTKRYLFSELQLLAPKIIVLLGATVTEVFFGNINSLGQERGHIHWLGPWALLPTYALGYVHHRGKEAKDALIADLRTAYTFCYQ